jgi:hypothetical protein
MLMLNMVKCCVQTELDDFFKVLSSCTWSSRVVTSSAFTQARQKFSYKAFIELNKVLCSTFYKHNNLHLWHGLRLLAIDGSMISLPSCDKKQRLRDHFGTQCDHASSPILRLSTLFDVYNKITIDVQTSTFKEGERSLALKHLEVGARKGDLILYDRGYPAYWLFAYHMQQGLHYCARASSTANKYVKAFIASGEAETRIMYNPDKNTLKEAQDRDIDTTPFTVRLIRIVLPNGEVEVLMTSLVDDKAYPQSMFEDLYHQRWFIEEDYKVSKSRMELENFSGLTVEAIYQDIHAKILSKNMVAVAIFEAIPIADERYKHRKWDYKINFTTALSKFKDDIVTIVRCAKVAKEYVQHVLNELSLNVHAVRPGRKYKRNARTVKQKKVGRHQGYKRTK